MSWFHTLAIALATITLAYFAALNVVYLAFTAIAWRDLNRHLRARGHAPDDEIFSSPVTPPVSVLVPAYNEEPTIVESVRSLLGLRYPLHEVIVVNDGSSDATLGRLRESFDLVPVRKALRVLLPTAPIRGVYVSRRHHHLWVVDKENGGKADALNAAVNTSRYPYVLAIDADAILEEDSLLRVVRPVVAEPDVVVATGGIVRIANGCRIDHGRVYDVRLPRSRLATLQVLEYFRAFLIGRVGWSRMNALLIISGAFGLFRRSLVETVGGYSNDTVGEDIELVVRLTGTSGSAASATASSSCPTRSAGPRRPRRWASSRASGGAGTAGSARRCGVTAASRPTAATGPWAGRRCRTSSSSSSSARWSRCWACPRSSSGGSRAGSRASSSSASSSSRSCSASSSASRL